MTLFLNIPLGRLWILSYKMINIFLLLVYQTIARVPDGSRTLVTIAFQVWNGSD